MVDLSQLEKVKTDDELQTESARLAAIEYLKSTDWHVVTQMEIGTPVPSDIQLLRTEARLALSVS